MEKEIKITENSKIELQKIVDELRNNPQLKRYVEECKLYLIDGNFKVLDILLKKGILN